MNSFIAITNFTCTFWFVNLTTLLFGNSFNIIAIQFILGIAYSYANYAFINYYKKNYQEPSIKALLVAFLGGFYYLFNFRFKS